MARRATVDPEVLKKIEEKDPEAMSDDEVLGIFEHLAIAYAKNPRLRGAGVFKQRFRSVLLGRMTRADPGHPPHPHVT
jgi:hypothetical protein